MPFNFYMKGYIMKEDRKLMNNWSKGLLFQNGETLKDRKFITNEGIRKMNSQGLVNIPYICGECGCNGEWNGKKITLELHHKDGNHKNNIESNLVYLCPNCHSQTFNYRYRNRSNNSKHINIKKEIVYHIHEYDFDLEKLIVGIKYPHKLKAYRAYIELLKNGIILINDNTETYKRLKMLTEHVEPKVITKVVVKKEYLKRPKDPDSWIKFLTKAERKIWFDIVSPTFSLNRDDPNYISEAKKLISEECKRQRNHVRTFLGKHHTENTKLIVSLKMKEKSTGIGNFMTGKCWICNDNTKETKIILKEELENYLNLGWRKGRFFKNLPIPKTEYRTSS